jgi:hypothetical protein
MPASHRLRRLATRRNPLVRPVDVVEAWVTFLLVTALVLTGPVLAWKAGATVHDQAMRSVGEARLNRFPTEAVLEEAPAEPVQSGEAADQPRAVPVRVRWTGPDGSQHSAEVVPDSSTRKAGEVVQIWTNAAGDGVPAPPGEGRAVGDAVIVGMIILILTGTTLLGVRIAARRALDRRRYAQWQAAWRAIEPRWSGRRHGAAPTSDS